MSRLVLVSTILAALALSACGGYGASALRDPQPTYGVTGRAGAEAASVLRDPQPAYGVTGGPVAEAEGSAPTATRGSDEYRASAEPAPEQRRGLATQWGESRHSVVRTTPFVRAEEARPTALTSLHYDDPSGAAAQAALATAEQVPSVSLVDGVHGHRVEVSLRDERGQPLPAYVVGERVFVVGQAGQRYSIRIENRTPYRFEVVASVDGLDVIRGTDASLAHRGYIVSAWGTVDIDGFRQSTESVAAFRFGAVATSYAAQTTGSARNVGVIGLALFGEAGASVPASWLAEAQLRARANPFPGGGGFAQPPPLRYGY